MRRGKIIRNTGEYSMKMDHSLSPKPPISLSEKSSFISQNELQKQNESQKQLLSDIPSGNSAKIITSITLTGKIQMNFSEYNSQGKKNM